jgi:Flp pilus assembly protein TadG
MKLSMIAWREERGVSAVIVAVAMVAIFGAAMLAVDAGNLWQTRRNAVTSTDAAALRAAQDVALDPTLIGGASCGTNWLAQLQANTASAATQPQMTCTAYHPVNSQTGYVTVAGTLLSQAKFGKVLGIGDQRPFSSTSVEFGYVPGITGLRPIGFCNQISHVQEWLALKADPTNTTLIAAYNALPTVEHTDPLTGQILHPVAGDLHGPTNAAYDSSITGHVVHRVMFPKDAATQCGDTTSGNWGFLDFDGGNNSNSALGDWFLDGYEGTVTVGDCDSNGSTDPCAGGPGFGGGGGASCSKNPNSIQDALNCLLGKTFAVVIYDGGTCTSGGGNNCSFNVWQFLIVRLWGYKLGNNGSDSDSYFDLEFTDSIIQGPCCEVSPTNANTGILGIKICSVDHDPGDVSLHCTPT